MKRIILLLVLIAGMNYLYKALFWESDLQEHSKVINLVRAIPDSAKIVYIGESSNITFREDDLDKRPISAFISVFFPDMEVYDITKPASHAGIYKTLLRQIPGESKVETIIVTLNLRSFNATWIYSDLETALQKSMVLLKDYPPLLNRFMLSFKAYDIKTPAEREKQFKEKWENDILKFPYEFRHKTVIEWDNWMANKGVEDSSGNIDQKQTELACHYIKTYGFQIDTNNNPRIKDFNEIIKLAENRGWKLVFNLLAENTEKAGDLVGSNLTYLMEQNRKILTTYYRNKGIRVVDNMYAVPNEQFIDQNWTTEHYAENGRKTIAGNVARELKNIYPEDFVSVDYKNSFKTEFFNDCEKDEVWGQMQTITDEIAYSGDFSSKTGNGSEFSITFEYPLKRLPDSLKNEIQVEMQLYQTSRKHDGKFVIQAYGEELGHFWEGVLLTEETREASKWEKFSYNFTIPDKLKNAEIIKIYLFNPTQVPIFVDDFFVKIK